MLLTSLVVLAGRQLFPMLLCCGEDFPNIVNSGRDRTGPNHGQFLACAMRTEDLETGTGRTEQALIPNDRTVKKGTGQVVTLLIVKILGTYYSTSGLFPNRQAIVLGIMSQQPPGQKKSPGLDR